MPEYFWLKNQNNRVIFRNNEAEIISITLRSLMLVSIVAEEIQCLQLYSGIISVTFIENNFGNNR